METKIAIVTGASSGLGREFVKLLVVEEDLDEIWIVARRKERLQQLCVEFGNKIKPFVFDLSNLENVNQFGEILKEKKVNIRFLINNAGYAKFCSYDDISIDESINMIQLNVNALVALGLHCIPFMTKGSCIMNIASQAAFQPLPYQNIYSATKSFVCNYSRALNVELKERGILVLAVCPGWIKTELFDRARIGAKKEIHNYVGMLSPEVVAGKAMRDAKKGRDISVCGAYVKIGHFLAKVLPQRIMMKIWLFQQR